MPVSDDLGEPGPPLDHRAPFFVGFVGGLGVLIALWLAMQIRSIGSTLMLIVVALFLAAGPQPRGRSSSSGAACAARTPCSP